MHGKTLWGDELLASTPRFALSEIPLEDGFWLLMNRVIELLEVIGSTPRLQSLPAETRHRATKLCLDMATSYLLFSGRYEPSYRARAAALAGIMKETPVVPLECARSAERTLLATRWKVEDGVCEPVETEADLIDLVADVRRLWRWELERLGQASDGPETDRKAVSAWCSEQAYRSRLRGWAFVARECGWQRSAIVSPHWMLAAFRGSPRRLIYTAASALFFALPQILPGSSEILNQSSRRYLIKLLPTPSSLSTSTSWRLAAAAIAFNYHRFLENTRA